MERFEVVPFVPAV